MNKVGNIGKDRFDNPERKIADLGPTFRDLSIGTLRLCGLFDCLAAA